MDALTGSRRANLLVSLRSLFAFAKKTGKVFRDPTRGIRVGQHPYRLAQRLDQDDVDQATEAATTPAARLVLMLAAVQAATLERLRVDRQLEEALVSGPDPLHLAAVFGLDPKTAICYAENARALLVTMVEEQDSTGRDEPKGPRPI
ncbi:hypothetical protein [Planobispora takensis]|uniref:hypothetical protein n=1 Tax=Planobispora takensis TaxID=1367882 RepID=UPI0019433E14|nr:hypothetical protein [Planobispora takensis]